MILLQIPQRTRYSLPYFVIRFATSGSFEKTLDAFRMHCVPVFKRDPAHLAPSDFAQPLINDDLLLGYAERRSDDLGRLTRSRKWRRINQVEWYVFKPRSCCASLLFPQLREGDVGMNI